MLKTEKIVVELTMEELAFTSIACDRAADEMDLTGTNREAMHHAKTLWNGIYRSVSGLAYQVHEVRRST